MLSLWANALKSKSTATSYWWKIIIVWLIDYVPGAYLFVFIHRFTDNQLFHTPQNLTSLPLLLDFHTLSRMQNDQPASCSPADRSASQTKYRKWTKMTNLFWHDVKQNKLFVIERVKHTWSFMQENLRTFTMFQLCIYAYGIHVHPIISFSIVQSAWWRRTDVALQENMTSH